MKPVSFSHLQHFVSILSRLRTQSIPLRLIELFTSQGLFCLVNPSDRDIMSFKRKTPPIRYELVFPRASEPHNNQVYRP